MILFIIMVILYIIINYILTLLWVYVSNLKNMMFSCSELDVVFIKLLEVLFVVRLGE